MPSSRIYAIVVIFICLDIILCVPIDDKTAELETLKSDKLKLEYADEITLLKQEIISLQERVSQLEFKSNGIENGLLSSELSYYARKNQPIHQLKKRAVRRRRRRLPEVAFQAALTVKYTTVELNDAIIFNDVITNIGGAYNKQTGEFTAPFAGTYNFNTNIVSEKGHYVEAAIEVNGKATVSAISDHRIAPSTDYLGIWDQGNAVAILRLQRGDNVRVSVQWPQGSHAIHGVGKTSFSGYLVRLHE